MFGPMLFTEKVNQNGSVEKLPSDHHLSHSTSACGESTLGLTLVYAIATGLNSSALAAKEKVRARVE